MKNSCDDKFNGKNALKEIEIVAWQHHRLYVEISAMNKIFQKGIEIVRADALLL